MRKYIAKKTILITGGTGFIGSHMIENLFTDGHKIILLKRSTSNTWRIKDYVKKIEMYDINHLTDIENVFKKYRIDLIIHLATTYIKKHQSTVDILRMNNSNIDFPVVLLDYATRYNVYGFINTGTCFEYKLTKKPISEKAKKEPYNYYAVTKTSFEEILRFYCKKGAIKAITLKIFYPYGPKDHNNKLIPHIMQHFINKTPIKINNGNQSLGYTYVFDIIEAYLKAFKYIFSTSCPRYEVFNIGVNKDYKVKDLINILFKITKKSVAVKYVTIPCTSDEIIHMSCNYQKAKKILHWSPNTNIEKGLKATYNYYFKNIEV